MITHVNFCVFYSRACFVNSSKSSSRSRFLGMLPTKRRWLLNDIVTPSFFPFLSSKSFNWKTRKCYSFIGLKVQEDIHSSTSGTCARCSQIQCSAVYVPHQITWNDHRSALQIRDFIANCVHSVCVFIERGAERGDMEKLPDKLFWSPNPANRLHEKYTQVLRRKSAKSICWCLIHTRPEGANFHMYHLMERLVRSILQTLSNRDVQRYWQRRRN